MGQSSRARGQRIRRGGALVLAFVTASVMGTGASAEAAAPGGGIFGIVEAQGLDGGTNNRSHPEWGRTNTIYPRVGDHHYADGVNQAQGGPNTRYISNRVINGGSQQLYSERGVSQWGFVWGQFLDHTIAQRVGRRQTGPSGEEANIPFDNADPLESSRNDLGFLFFERSIAEEGTGVTVPREQINAISSYIDAATVYSNADARLDWIREGTVDGNPANNGARLLMPGGYLPRAASRGNWETAPPMVVGSLFATPEVVAVAGDQRANENPGLLATHTLFNREHNRIVSKLPSWMSEQDKFQVARAVLIAEMQYITYQEFLPSLGVRLPAYSGYKPGVDAGVTNEFATVGYRAHSMIGTHYTMKGEPGRWSQADLDYFASVGVTVKKTGNQVVLSVPIGEETFFNPDLLERLQLGPVLRGVSSIPQNKNDEIINDLMRNGRFDFSGNPGCAEDPSGPTCIAGVNDLAAVDIERGRDHGLGTYNQLRAAYGLPPKTSFTAITGEATQEFPADPLLTAGNEINDPNIMDYTALYDINGHATTAQADNAVRGVRRTTTAARLKAIYGTVDQVDAFTGLIAEKHVPGTEFGELQLAIWKHQFQALRDGDRFFFANDPLLPLVRNLFGIDYRVSLGDVIARNTDIPRSQLARNVFLTPDQQRSAQLPPAPGERLLPGPNTRQLTAGWSLTSTGPRRNELNP